MLKVNTPGILMPTVDLKTEKRIGEAINSHTAKAGRRLTSREVIAIIQITGFNSSALGIGEFQ